MDDKREMGGGVETNHSLRKRWDGDISKVTEQRASHIIYPSTTRILFVDSSAI